MGIIALVFGLLGFMGCPIFGPVAIIVGLKARDADPKGLGRIGIVLGAIATVFLVFWVLFILVAIAARS